jgi:hypothetical protein
VPAYSPTHLLKDSKAEGVTQILGVCRNNV